MINYFLYFQENLCIIYYLILFYSIYFSVLIKDEPFKIHIEYGEISGESSISIDTFLKELTDVREISIPLDTSKNKKIKVKLVGRVFSTHQTVCIELIYYLTSKFNRQYMINFSKNGIIFMAKRNGVMFGLIIHYTNS